MSHITQNSSMLNRPSTRGFFMPQQKFLFSHREQKGTFPLQLISNQTLVSFSPGTLLEQNALFREQILEKWNKLWLSGTKTIIVLPHWHIAGLSYLTAMKKLNFYFLPAPVKKTGSGRLLYLKLPYLCRPILILLFKRMHLGELFQTIRQHQKELKWLK